MVKPESKPIVATIILNWNGKDDTLECVESVLQSEYSDNRIIVVDNGSSDDSVEAIRAQYPGIDLIETNENLGFAEGNNVGIRHAIKEGADYIFLLNNDAVVSETAHQHLLEAAQQYNDAAILGAKTYYYDNPDVLWFDGGYWDSDKLEFYHKNLDESDSDGSDRITECDYICGCALFIPTNVINRIGLMDKDFFLTYEETDWCYRGKAQEIPSLLVSTAKVWHKVSVSFGGDSSPLQEYFHTRNLLYWAEKHLTTKQYIRVLFKTIKRAVGWDENTSTLKSRYWNLRRLTRLFLSGQQPTMQARKYGLRDYLMRKRGDCPLLVRTL